MKLNNPAIVGPHSTVSIYGRDRVVVATGRKLGECEIVHRLRPGGETIEHVRNTEYVRWLDRAAELHADSLGYTRQRMLGEGVMWFVARHEIDYLAEVWCNDKLVIATWVRDMQRVKSWRDYVVIRPADEIVVCRAATLWVFIDLARRRPQRIPDEVAQRFSPLRRARAQRQCTS